jgi:hypothetical protein
MVKRPSFPASIIKKTAVVWIDVNNTRGWGGEIKFGNLRRGNLDRGLLSRLKLGKVDAINWEFAEGEQRRVGPLSPRRFFFLTGRNKFNRVSSSESAQKMISDFVRAKN